MAYELSNPGNVDEMNSWLQAANFLPASEADALIDQQQVRARQIALSGLAEQISWQMPKVVYGEEAKYGPPEWRFDGIRYNVGTLLHRSQDMMLVSSLANNYFYYVQNNQGVYTVTAEEIDYKDDLLLPRIAGYVAAHYDAQADPSMPEVIADEDVVLLYVNAIESYPAGKLHVSYGNFFAGKPKKWQEMLPRFVGRDWPIRIPYEKHDVDRVLLYKDGVWSEVLHTRSRAIRKLNVSEWPRDHVELAEPSSS